MQTQQRSNQKISHINKQTNLKTEKKKNLSTTPQTANNKEIAEYRYPNRSKPRRAQEQRGITRYWRDAISNFKNLRFLRHQSSKNFNVPNCTDAYLQALEHWGIKPSKE